MATKKKANSVTRRCVGSKTFGIESHDAPVADFPAQPSRKDGLGVMCKPHWSQYTGALRKAALGRKAAGVAAAPTATDSQNVEAALAEATPTRKTSKAPRAATSRSIKRAVAKARGDAPAPGNGLGAYRAEHRDK